ncbi:MAG TPA: hypothetical protein VFQ38_08095 [Longimicrobiales bacterium]|nr:hypothetical protein [Longimicrobiales bacterium]
MIALLCVGCAATTRAAGGSADVETTVSVRSLHDHAMELYTLCGEHDAVRLGSVPALGEAEFSVPAAAMLCAPGLRFAMVPVGRTGGYITDPVSTTVPRHIDLRIEKYPALSDWQAR